jgi:hypothetical protein
MGVGGSDNSTADDRGQNSGGGDAGMGVMTNDADDMSVSRNQ